MVWNPRCSSVHLLASVLLTVSGILPGVPLTAQQTVEARVGALCDSAYAQLQRGDAQAALTSATRAVELDRDSARAHTCLGRVCLEIPNRTHRALECFRTSLYKDPDRVETLYWKARAHLRLAPTDIGQFNSREALHDLEHLLELDPSHPDASYLCGIIQRDFREDHDAAIVAFRLQIAANPGHEKARAALMRALIDSGRWNEAVTLAEELLARDQTAWSAYLYLAAAHWKAERYDEAMAAFERCFAAAPEEERNLFFDLGLVLTPDEAEDFARLDSEGRRTYWNQYWRMRNPDPKTAVNERLLEHFIRVAYARIMYGDNEWPWDDRGAVYVRYGEPDIQSGRGRVYAWDLIKDDPIWKLRARDLAEELGYGTEQGLPPPLLSTAPLTDQGPENPFAQQRVRDASGQAISSSSTPENWGYEDRGLIVAFEDFAMSGRYIVSSVHRQVMDLMERVIPTMSEEEDRIETIDPMDFVVTFRGEEGKTALEYAFALMPDEFGAFRSVTGAYATIDVEVQLYDVRWKPVAGQVEPSRRLSTVPQVQIRGVPLFIDATRIEVEPGDYTLTTLLIDPETGKRATSREEVALPDYSGNRLMVSDILPAASIREVGSGHSGRFIRGDLEVLPLPGRIVQVDQPLFIYFEVYNLQQDDYGATRYQVEYSVAEAPPEAALGRLYQGLRSLVGRGGRQAVLSSEFTGSDIRRDLQTWLEIDMSHLEHGTYELRVTIIDLVSGQQETNGLSFRTLPPPPAP